MPYDSLAELPDQVRDALPAEAQRVWMSAYNSAAEEHDDEGTRAAIAWSAVRQAGWEQENDEWVKKDIKEYKRHKVFSAWRCSICHHVYLGYAMPDRCPHCGAKGAYMKAVYDYTHIEAVPLSESSRILAQKALEAEATCEAYYRCCEENALSVYAESYFRRLARHEQYHKEELAALLGVSEPALPAVTCPEKDSEKFLVGAKLEAEVIKFYRFALQTATEPRVKELYTAFLDVEYEHKDLTLAKAEKDKYGAEHKQLTPGDVHVQSPLEIDLGELDTQIVKAQQKRQTADDIDEEPVQKSLTATFIKADNEQQLVTGIVLEPETVDAQGDIISAEVIEKAAHSFLAKSRIIGKQHKGKALADVVESYIAPEETKIGEQVVNKGTWIMSVKVHDDNLWEEVKRGEITGFSIGAMGVREQVA